MTLLKKRGAKPVKLSLLKKKLWKLCREITIKRHGTSCYTCPAVSLTGSNLHCGHYISSSVCSAELRYSLDNLRPQCYRCNIHLSGNWPSFEVHLKRDGVDTEELKQRNEQTKGKQYDRLFYERKIEEYDLLLQSLYL
jgi:hypothetical protein